MLSNCIAEVKRLVYTGNVANGKETIGSYSWYLTAVNENSQLMTDGKFWKLYKLSILSFPDIKEADEVVVDGISYTVKWIAYRHCWRLSLTTVILEKWL